jgi:hypothetical protein
MHLLGRYQPKVTVGRPGELSAEDHEWMRRACETGSQLVRAAREVPSDSRIFKARQG